MLEVLGALRPSCMAFQIGAAGADHVPIPDGGLPLPGVSGARLLPGLEAPDFRDWTLGQAVHLVARIAPWATVWAAPGWDGPKGLRSGPMAWAGTAWAGEGVAVVNSGRRGPLFLATLLHELWHLIEDRLSVTDRVTLSCIMLDGQGLAWQGDYNASGREILARAFASYASAKLLEGFDVRGVPVFDAVLEGRAVP